LKKADAKSVPGYKLPGSATVATATYRRTWRGTVGAAIHAVWRATRRPWATALPAKMFL
jgi:hypothetical protein